MAGLLRPARTARQAHRPDRYRGHYLPHTIYPSRAFAVTLRLASICSSRACARRTMGSHWRWRRSPATACALMEGIAVAKQNEMRTSAAPLRLFKPARHHDSRGWFSESYNREAAAAVGITSEFVQDNHSLSRRPFTIRGLHFQAPPHAQEKLVRCIRGRIFDVAVDLRWGSPTFGLWAGAELSAEGGEQMFVPSGFAHGFLTLVPDCEVVYKCTKTYSPAAEGGLRWDDPAVAIAWPLPAGVVPIISPKDAEQPELQDLASTFVYNGVPMTSFR